VRYIEETLITAGDDFSQVATRRRYFALWKMHLWPVQQMFQNCVYGFTYCLIMIRVSMIVVIMFMTLIDTV